MTDKKIALIGKYFTDPEKALEYEEKRNRELGKQAFVTIKLDQDGYMVVTALQFKKIKK